ncbi:MAG: HAD-IIIA family hydrolase [Betaproteobacteria bacterium]|nr:HAD-IIIA family hydrolase [Betaproteobacteria bacterium]
MADPRIDKAANIRLAVFDVDGVLTDGTLFISDRGEETKGFNIRDGLGLRLLKSSGVDLAILTSRRSGCVERRCVELGIELVMQGVTDKRVGFNQLLESCHLRADQVSYMGDDLVDLPVLKCCGFSATVPDAPNELRALVDYTTRSAAGNGAVREFCELVMRAQGTYERMVAPYLA